MSWIVGAIITPIITYLGNKVGQGISWLFQFIVEYQKRKSIYEDGINQSKVVDEIAEQIKKLIAEGKPVPPELQKRLVDESSKINVSESFPN